MQKVNKLMILSFLGLSSAVSASALPMYLRADVGNSFLAAKPNKVDYLSKPNSSMLYGVGLGCNITEDIRADIVINKRAKYSYSNFTSGAFESQKIESTSLMLNGYYDFIDNDNLTPYLMVGVGVARNKAGNYDTFLGNYKESHPEHSKNNFAFQFGGGIGHKITENLSLDLGYKYVNLGKISTKKTDLSEIKGRLTAHEVSVGLIYNFN